MTKRIDLADAQFLGYWFGKWSGTGIIGMVESMNLSKKEWIKLQSDYPIIANIDESEIKEIDNYFKTLKNDKRRTN